MANARRLPFKLVKGQLKFFTPDIVLARQQGGKFSR